MQRKFMFPALLLAFLVIPASALAKGPASASVDGPGLASAIAFKGGGGDPGPGTPLGQLTESAGYFAAMFGQSPDPMLAKPPAGELGQKYTITWKVPGPNSTSATIRQDLYPYATPNPLTYMQRGQPIWEGQTTRGGWFQAPPTLKDTLVRAGLPTTAPSPGGSGLDASMIGAIAAAVATLLLAAYAILRLRRRPRPITVA